MIELVIRFEKRLDSNLVEMEKSEIDDLYCSEVNISIIDKRH